MQRGNIFTLIFEYEKSYIAKIEFLTFTLLSSYRLYFFQMKGLKILSRLFIGRKRNPLPGSVHSSPYTTEQLLFGTVSFTVILFLLPTTLIYYVVFTGVRMTNFLRLRVFFLWCSNSYKATNFNNLLFNFR